MKFEITPVLVAAVEAGAQALRTQISGTIHSHEYDKLDPSGNMKALVDEGVERMQQEIDTLDGWCKRARFAIKEASRA